MNKPDLKQIMDDFEEYYRDVDSLVKTSVACVVDTGSHELIKAAMKDAYMRGYFSAIVSMIHAIDEFKAERFGSHTIN